MIDYVYQTEGRKDTSFMGDIFQNNCYRKEAMKAECSQLSQKLDNRTGGEQASKSDQRKESF